MVSGKILTTLNVLIFAINGTLKFCDQRNFYLHDQWNFVILRLKEFLFAVNKSHD